MLASRCSKITARKLPRCGAGTPAKNTYCDLSSFGPALFEIWWPDIYLGGPYGPVKDEMYWSGGLKSAPGQRASAYVEGWLHTSDSMSDRRSRGHTLKLEKPSARLDIRKHFFSNRVIDAWNALPGNMVEATSTNMFKAALQRLPHGAFKSWKQLPAPRGHLTT